MHHFEAGARGGIHCRGVDGTDSFQILADGFGIGLLAQRRYVLQHPAHGCICARIHAQRGCAFRLVCQQAPGDLVKDARAFCRIRCSDGGAAGGQGGKGRARAKCGKGLAAGEGHRKGRAHDGDWLQGKPSKSIRCGQGWKDCGGAAREQP